MKKVSIVIVCMNNLKNLYPCLDSIITHTSVDYEIIVVAFMFSEDNIVKLKNSYPSVIIVRSDELRGFSENNNLGLRQANGEYSFVLNDDTYFDTPVIDRLVQRLDSMDAKVAIISPLILNTDGSIQRNGKCKYDIFTFILGCLHLKEFYDKHSKYTGKTGLYRTYNISGACFLIRTSIFKEAGWFDERYYFCPEDIALSTKLNKNGYSCYVDTEERITHIHGGTWSKILTATMPTVEKGNKIFYCENNRWFIPIFLLCTWCSHCVSTAIWWLKYLISRKEECKIKSIAHFNTVKNISTNETPKECFVRLYKSIKQ